ncbi:MAG: hypothetical protein GVY18_09360 [Bacteroidetes bacterium]|nr:hypothetical protein [Bacteroidota bacterium]
MIYSVIAGATGLVATVWLGGIFVNLGIRPFAVQMKDDNAVAAGGRVIEPLENGFEDGGRVIGLYERLLIFVFVIAGAPAAIGFLVAAKSLFRFGDLKDDEHRKNAEYIIIGTLMSFAFALVVAYGTRFLLTVLGGL